MARKIFVSYKHSDDSVKPLSIYRKTARTYVDEIIKLFEGDEIYKGEGNEDLSEFKDDTIATHLKDKIYDSSITLFLISPNMKDTHKRESDQWIPWEISYSLKAITRGERTSHTTGILAIVLPDLYSSYSYFLEENTCPSCHCITLYTDILFQILRDNMLNIKKPTFYNCSNYTAHMATNPVYIGSPSYIHPVKWCDFIKNKEKYLQEAGRLRDNIDYYNIKKIVEN